MPKVVSTASSCTILGRPRRTSRLPARYRTDPSPATAPPAVPHRGADNSHNSVSGTRPSSGSIPPARGTSGSLSFTEDRVEENRAAQVGQGQPGCLQRTLMNSRAANPARSADDHSVERKQQRLIEEKDACIEELKGRIRRLERSERRLKAQVIEGSDNFANKDAELGEVTRALQSAQEGLEEKEDAMRKLIKEVHHYQGWWLNEYYCLKVALKLARNQNDEGVKAMRESSTSRFMAWSGLHQN